MEMRERKKIVKDNCNDSRFQIIIPKYFLREANKLNCKMVLITMHTKKSMSLWLLNKDNMGQTDEEFAIRPIIGINHHINLPAGMVKENNLEDYEYVVLTLPESDRILVKFSKTKKSELMYEKQEVYIVKKREV